MKRLPEKGTLESVVIGFDFARDTNSVSLPTITCEVDNASGTDSNPTALLDGDPAIDATYKARVLQRVTGGVDLTDYRIECTVQTPTGDTLTLPVVLPVRARL